MMKHTNGHKSIQVALVEDNKEVATEIQGLLTNHPQIQCKYVYHRAEDAVTFLPRHDVDIVLMDIGFPGMSGIEAVVRLRERMPNAQYCMLTVFEDDEKIFQSISAGAKGYILKNASEGRVIEAILELSEGGSPISPIIARKVLQAFSRRSEKSTSKNYDLPLTDREFEILEELAKGLLYKEIALKLNITTGTVKQHIHKIYHKLQVNNRTEAINVFLNRNDG